MPTGNNRKKPDNTPRKLAPPKRKSGRSNALGEVLQDERSPKILGLLMLLTSVYLLIAFISYLFTWKEDQDLVNRFYWSLVWATDIEVENWLGRLGAIVAHQFIYWWFGLASFIFIFLFFITGLSLIQRIRLRRLYRIYRYSLFFVIWFSVLFSFVFSLADFPFGGAIGQGIKEWLNSFLGFVGVVAGLLFSFFALIIWNKNPNLEDITFSRLVTDVRDALNLDYLISAYQSSFRREEEEDDNEDEDEEDDDDLEAPEITEKPKTKTITPARLRAEELLNSYSEGDDEEEDENTNISLQELEEKAKELTQGSIDFPTNFVPRPPAPQINANSNDEFEINVPLPRVPGPEEAPNGNDSINNITEENPEHWEPYDSTLDLPAFENPVLALLESYEDQQIVVDRVELEQNKDQIINTLLHYKIEITKIKATIGPTVTLYEIIPAPGVRIAKIKNLEDDIALSLAALGIRIIAPIPGKGTIGIEVPNRNKQVVFLREVLENERFKRAKMDLPIALGKTISNEVFVADLAKMPHLLVAGATGQGKSVGVNTILMSVLYKKHPSQVKMVLVDPKKVELSPYNQLDHHYLACLPSEEEAIITDTARVITTLQSLTIEMDERYNLLKKASVRHISEYNMKFVSRKLNPEKGHRFLPFIILVIDEFADLIMTAGKEVELPIGRLAQLARAVGIHLIIATQRPSVNIITGVIKANFPARLAFKVTSKIDSRTILDSGGAEQLIGRGDMLLSVGGDIIRLQCAFVDTPEVERVVEFIAKQKAYPEPFYLPDYSATAEDSAGGHHQETKKIVEQLDEHFEDSARLVVIHQSGSTSMIQRRLKLGYNRAGRIMDQLEALGIVGAADNSKPREVLFGDEVELEKYLKILREKYKKD